MKGLVRRCNVEVVVYQGGSCGYFVCGGSTVYHGAACSLSITLSARELLLWLHIVLLLLYTGPSYHPQASFILRTAFFISSCSTLETMWTFSLQPGGWTGWLAGLAVVLLSGFLFLLVEETITAGAKRICKLQVSSFYFWQSTPDRHAELGPAPSWSRPGSLMNVPRCGDFNHNVWMYIVCFTQWIL